MGGSMGTETDTLSKAQKAVAIAAARKDCLAFVSPHKGNLIGSGGTALNASEQRTNALNFFNNVTSTSFAVIDSGYKYTYDRFNDKYRWVATNGDIAGLCVNTSTTQADWISPAGLARGGVRNVVKLAYNPNKADRDELYQNRINPIVSFPGSGAVLFGDKTALASPSAFDRINVRRLFLNIEKRVEALGKAVLFEINDETTRSGFLATINGYLNEISAQQGITDFLVVCDETNNTPNVIDRNEFVAELFIKPARSINYVTVTFTATRTGVSFSEVVGR
jgi:phage tail sheath protein FI